MRCGRARYWVRCSRWPSLVWCLWFWWESTTATFKTSCSHYSFYLVSDKGEKSHMINHRNTLRKKLLNLLQKQNDRSLPFQKRGTFEIGSIGIDFFVFCQLDNFCLLDKHICYFFELFFWKNLCSLHKFEPHNAGKQHCLHISHKALRLPLQFLLSQRILAAQPTPSWIQSSMMMWIFDMVAKGGGPNRARNFVRSGGLRELK